MSIQSAKDFIKQIETDPALKARLEAAVDDETRQQIIQAAGFVFTREEFKQAVAEISTSADQELSPEELTDIAAGTGQAGWCVTHDACSSHGCKFIC
jgi:predicted ribosomally synthesized peptide with nif11-like leader